MMGWPLAWCDGDEVLIVIRGAGQGRTLIGVNPIENRTVHLSSIGEYRIRIAENDSAIELRDSEERLVRVITLASPPAECAFLGNDSVQTGELRYVNNAIYVGEQLIQPDRGLRFRILGSPSGRFVAVVERQGLYRQMLYQISTDHSYDVEVVREVALTEMPLEYQLVSEESPDGNWTVHIDNERIELVGLRGEQRRTLPFGGSHGPWWSPDSQQFAFAQDRWLVVAGVDGSLQCLVYDPWVFVGWTDGGVAWLHSSLQ